MNNSAECYLHITRGDSLEVVALMGKFSLSQSYFIQLTAINNDLILPEKLLYQQADVFLKTIKFTGIITQITATENKFQCEYHIELAVNLSQPGKTVLLSPIQTSQKTKILPKSITVQGYDPLGQNQLIQTEIQTQSPLYAYGSVYYFYPNISNQKRLGKKAVEILNSLDAQREQVSFITDNLGIQTGDYCEVNLKKYFIIENKFDYTDPRDKKSKQKYSNTLICIPHTQPFAIPPIQPSNKPFTTGKIVKKYDNGDYDCELDIFNKIIRAPICFANSSNQSASQFFLKPNTTVLIGFLYDQWDCPIILGVLPEKREPVLEQAELKTINNQGLLLTKDSAILSTTNNLQKLCLDSKGISLKNRINNIAVNMADDISLLSKNTIMHNIKQNYTNQIASDFSMITQWGKLIIKTESLDWFGGSDIKFSSKNDFIINTSNILNFKNNSLNIFANHIMLQSNSLCKIEVDSEFQLNNLDENSIKFITPNASIVFNPNGELILTAKKIILDSKQTGLKTKTSTLN